MILSVIASIIYVLLNSMSIWLIGTMLANVMGSNSLSIVNPTNLNEHLNFFEELVPKSRNRNNKIITLLFLKIRKH